jgi:hypothetical protein
MKTKLSKTTLCGALLAIVLATGGYSATNSYVNFAEETRCSQQLIAECEHMFQTDCLNELQIEARNDGNDQAVQGLDKLVDANIETIKAQLSSSDAAIKTLAKAVLKHVAHRRAQADSMNAPLSANRQ